MLLEFSTANFLSFRHRATLSMLAAEGEQDLGQNTLRARDGTSLLRCAAIYGANASGKSNLIKALRFMRQFVLNSAKESQTGESIPVQRFKLSVATEGKPSEFEVVFFIDEVRYRYGFAADERHVQEEWLYAAQGDEEKLLFNRTKPEHGSVQVAADFDVAMPIRTRENALFLSTAGQSASEKDQVGHIVAWFRDLRLVSGLSEQGHVSATVERLNEVASREEILALSRQADPTLTNIQAERQELPGDLPDDVRKHIGVIKWTTSRDRFDADDRPIGSIEFEWREESEGTRKLIGLAGTLLEAVQRSQVVVIDEMDARLHPVLTRAVVKMFLAGGARSTAQLIFATHDTNLLDPRLLRKDQIWFMEKDRTANTDLYSLAEFEVPADAPYEQDYIQGRYGAIPYLGRFPFLSGAGA